MRCGRNLCPRVLLGFAKAAHAVATGFTVAGAILVATSGAATQCLRPERKSISNSS